MAALSMFEMAKLKPRVEAAFIMVFAMSTVLSRFIRYITVPGGIYRYNLEEALPGVAFRGLYEMYTPTIGLINPQYEVTKAMGGLIEVDRKIRKEQGEGAVNRHRTMQLKNMGIRYSIAFIKGNATATANREFDGLQSRLTGRQLLIQGVNGAALSLATLDDAISRTMGADVIFCNRQMKNRFSQAMRNQAVAGNINYLPNTGPGALQGFGQQILTYNGLPVVDYGEDETGEDILQFNEVQGASSVATSIYIVSFQPGMVEGIQSTDIEVELDVDNGKPTVQADLVEWLTGLTMQHPRSATRIAGILDAPIVA